jgi:putative spermidine/putrescine transport system substrate-binding protein
MNAQMSRRRFLQVVVSASAGGIVLAACGGSATPTSSVATSAPEVNKQAIKDIVLRQIGTGVSNINEIKDQAKKDLGFTIDMKSLSTTENNQIAITQPKQYDIFDGEYFSLPLVIPSGNLQPIDVKKIAQFDKITPIFTTGKLKSDSVIAQGTAPHKVMFLKDQASTEFADGQTQWATLIPTIYNADTLGYRPDLVGRKIESWAELFNAEFKGKTSLLDIPSIGIMDAAMVTEAAGMMKYADKGNMTKQEIDNVIGILIEQKKAGQFRSFWKTFDESVNLMSSGEVVLQSMWSPAVTAVKSKGIQCVYAPLKEGYRAWGGGLGLSKGLEGISLDAAYEYLNWWMSGWAGGFVGREGYYSSIPENAQKFMKPEEWDFWYEGKPAAIDIVDPYDKKMESKGAVRDGGAFEERMGRVACWNSVMKEQDYLVKKWNEFIAA